MYACKKRTLRLPSPCAACMHAACSIFRALRGSPSLAWRAHARQVLARLAQLPALRHLNLRGNPCCEEPGYRLQVVEALSGLEVLDWHQGALLSGPLVFACSCHV